MPIPFTIGRTRWKIWSMMKSWCFKFKRFFYISPMSNVGSRWSRSGENQRKNATIFRYYSCLHSRKSQSNCSSSGKTNHNDRSVASNPRSSSDITTGIGSRLSTPLEKSVCRKLRTTPIDRLVLSVDRQLGAERSTFSSDVRHSQRTVDHWANSCKQWISRWQNPTYLHHSSNDQRSSSL